MTAALAILAALAGACTLWLPWSARRYEERYSHAWDDKGD